MSNPGFRKHWHSAFTEASLTGLLQLVNKVYSQGQLSDPEADALDNLISVVTTTGHDKRIDPVKGIDRKLAMARAISNAVSDPMWRRMWDEFKVAMQLESYRL